MIYHRKFLLIFMLLLSVAGCSPGTMASPPPTRQIETAAPSPSETPAPSPSAIPSPAATLPPTGSGAGQIVFYSDRGGGYDSIYRMDTGGSGPARLTQGQSNFFSGPFSPDGTRLLFTGFGPTRSYVGVMNADGSEQTDLTNRPDSD